jgi:TolB-like protein/Tfp pilus assembly protein PilF
VAVAYVVTAWLVLQVADVVLNNISAPEWIFHVLLLFIVLGFPFAIIFAWVFELTPQGLRRDTGTKAGPAGHSGRQRKWEYLLLAAVVAVFAYFGWTRFGPGGSDPAASGEIRSIVVLPLENLMNDPDQSYFVEGMQEALITELSKIKALRVISRTSAMQYKDSGKQVPEIARELGVDAVVEGSVLKAGSKVRITAQLIDAHRDRHIWAENFDRELDDILALYEDVTREIVNQIRVTVTPDEQASLAISRQIDPEVYELYLKGRYLCGNWSPKEMRQGAKLLQRAVQLDPKHASSHAQLALCLQDGAFFEYFKPLEIDSLARQAARTAVELEDHSAEARVALGGVNYYLGFDPEAAEAEYFKALELNPNSVDVLLRISWFLAESGRFEEALGPTRHAVELDPLSTAVRNAMGQIYYLSRDYDRAILEYEKALELDPSDPSLHYYLAGPHEQQGRHEKAIALYQTAVELSENAPLYLAALGHVYARSGKRDEAVHVLAQLQQAEEPSPYPIALVHLGLGQNEQAIDWLEKAFAARNGHLLYIKQGPRFDPLRENLRFRRLLDQFGW